MAGWRGAKATDILYAIALKRDFPNLNWKTFEDKSDATIAYNCIAFTLSDKSRRWWPNTDGHYWPANDEGVPNEETVAAFVALYGTKRYLPCGLDGSFEPGFEKVAIYWNPVTQKPTHAAIQTSSGKWKSKLGQGIDIEHDSLVELAGPLYGEVACCLKRSVAETAKEEQRPDAPNTSA